MLSVAAGDSFYESITRAGDAIVFLATDYDVDPPGLRQITCSGGEPTVANTDTVVLQAPNGESIPRIDLRGGPFAPGATPEPDESSEIEFSLPGPPRAFGLLVRGSSDADSIRVGELGRDTGFNFNDAEANPDVDFRARGRQAGLILLGGGGDDRISLGGGPPFSGAYEAIVHGGVNDTATVQRLKGGPGSDLLIGGRSLDAITPGPGHDRVRSLGSGDLVFVRDRRRDDVRCGVGHDNAFPDPQDRLNDCEVQHLHAPRGR